MNILSLIERKAKSNHARIGVGVGEVSEDLLKSAELARDFADVVLIGDERHIRKMGSDFEVIHTLNPPQTLVELLRDGDIEGAVRGTLSATKTLTFLKKTLGLGKLYRVALLETAYGEPFFLAPVGIDEGNTLADKIELIERGVEHIKRLGVTVNVGVLSGGRLEDIGRDERVDRTLADAEFIARRVRDSGIDATHYAILIEDAVKQANFIIAPDGISGNLIFRTLVFLGAGCGYGAPVLMERVFVDTSRVRGDYSKAIMLASALKNPGI